MYIHVYISIYKICAGTFSITTCTHTTYTHGHTYNSPKILVQFKTLKPHEDFWGNLNLVGIGHVCAYTNITPDEYQVREPGFYETFSKPWKTWQNFTKGQLPTWTCTSYPFSPSLSHTGNGGSSTEKKLIPYSVLPSSTAPVPGSQLPRKGYDQSCGLISWQHGLHTVGVMKSYLLQDYPRRGKPAEPRECCIQ